MEIDIIDYTDERYANMKIGELQKVRDAQEKKNKLTEEYTERYYATKRKLIDGGVHPSTILSRLRTELTAAYNAEVERLREGLLFVLKIASGGSDGAVPTDVPYEVDYSLTTAERMRIVKVYYEEAYTDGQKRFDAFLADEFVEGYVEEYYMSLYYYFRDLS